MGVDHVVSCSFVSLTIIRQKEEAETKEKEERETREKLERKQMRRNMRNATRAQVSTQSIVYVPVPAPPPGMIATGPITPPPSGMPTPIASGAGSGYETDGSSDSDSDTRSLTTANGAESDNEAASGPPKEKWVEVKTSAAPAPALQDTAPVTAHPAM